MTFMWIDNEYNIDQIHLIPVTEDGDIPSQSVPFPNNANAAHFYSIIQPLYGETNSVHKIRNSNFYHEQDYCFKENADDYYDCAEDLECFAEGNSCQWDCSKLSPSNGCNAHMLFEPTSIDAYNTQNSVYNSNPTTNDNFIDRFITSKSLTEEIINFGNLNGEDKPYF